jgi:hypothetical protein
MAAKHRPADKEMEAKTRHQRERRHTKVVESEFFREALKNPKRVWILIIGIL